MGLTTKDNLNECDGCLLWQAMKRGVGKRRQLYIYEKAISLGSRLFKIKGPARLRAAYEDPFGHDWKIKQPFRPFTVTLVPVLEPK